jgi:hypothetical protein
MNGKGHTPVNRYRRLNCCPACGQIIPPDIALKGPVKQRIYNELKRAPRTPEELRELIWGSRRPIDHHAIYVHVMKLKQQLRPHGVTVRCEWRGAYRLEPLC